MRWKLHNPSWFGTSLPDAPVDVPPEVLDACQKRWELKWGSYVNAFPDQLGKDIAVLDAAAMRSRAQWLVSE